MKSMSMTRQWSLALPWLLIVISLVQPQTVPRPFAVSGVVQDSSGAVISGASVELRAAATTIQSTTTDDSGTFRFTQVPPGSYQIDVRYEGFEPAAISLEMAAGPSGPLRVVLEVAGVRQEASVIAGSARVSSDRQAFGATACKAPVTSTWTCAGRMTFY